MPLLAIATNVTIEICAVDIDMTAVTDAVASDVML
jgi:hypothetical protein